MEQSEIKKDKTYTEKILKDLDDFILERKLGFEELWFKKQFIYDYQKVEQEEQEIQQSLKTNEDHNFNSSITFAPAYPQCTQDWQNLYERVDLWLTDNKIEQVQPDNHFERNSCAKISMIKFDYNQLTSQENIEISSNQTKDNSNQTQPSSNGNCCSSQETLVLNMNNSQLIKKRLSKRFSKLSISLNDTNDELGNSNNFNSHNKLSMDQNETLENQNSPVKNIQIGSDQNIDLNPNFKYQTLIKSKFKTTYSQQQEQQEESDTDNFLKIISQSQILYY